MRDKIALWIAIHLPLRVRYWVTLQMVGNAMMQEETVQSPLTWSHIYAHLEHPKEKHAGSEH